MKILTTVEDGKLVPQKPIRFSRTTVEIEISDDVVKPVDFVPEHKLRRDENSAVQRAATGSKVDEVFKNLREQLGSDYVYIDDGGSDRERFADALDLLRKE
jgi:hypothetical protein